MNEGCSVKVQTKLCLTVRNAALHGWRSGVLLRLSVCFSACPAAVGVSATGNRTPSFSFLTTTQTHSERMNRSKLLSRLHLC